MSLRERVAGGPRLLWLDYTDYAGTLLAGGRVPWLDVGALLAWQRKAQALLRSDVVALPVGAVAAAWLGAHPALAAAMAAKSRTVFALKALLADEALRSHMRELAEGLRAGFESAPLALVCAAPRAWAGHAYLQAHGRQAEIDDDAADSAAVQVADFLRVFGESGIDVLMIEESDGGAEEQPVLNVAAHYRWEVVRRDAEALRFDDIATPAIPETYWNGGAVQVPGNGGLQYARIPADAQPEAVLDRLARLRGEGHP